MIKYNKNHINIIKQTYETIIINTVNINSFVFSISVNTINDININDINIIIFACFSYSFRIEHVAYNINPRSWKNKYTLIILIFIFFQPIFYSSICPYNAI